MKKKFHAIHPTKGKFTVRKYRMVQISTGGMKSASENAWQDFLITSFTLLSCEEIMKFASFDNGANTIFSLFA